MRIVQIESLENGAHLNQTVTGHYIPDGWAVIPDEMPCPNFPFGSLKTMRVDNHDVATEWIPSDLPDPAPRPAIPSDFDRLEAQVLYTALMTDTLIEKE